MVVRVDRVAVSPDRGRGVARLSKTFAIWPAIIGAGNAIIDFLPATLADVVDENSTCSWLDCEGKGIPDPQRPNRPVLAGRRAVERIAGRNGPVRIDA